MPAPLFLSLVLVFALDQMTKTLVLAHLDERQAIAWRGLAIRRLINRRGSVGMISSRRAWLALWIVALLLIVALVQLDLLGKGATAQIALGAALGGAGGNVTDRLWRGGVVDFFDVGFWPVFNVGDAAIVLGATIGIFYI